MAEEKLMNRRRMIAGLGAGVAALAAGPLFAAQGNRNCMRDNNYKIHDKVSAVAVQGAVAAGAGVG